jgi:integral membrane protein
MSDYDWRTSERRSRHRIPAFPHWSPSMSRPLAPAGRLFAVAAFIEGFTWAGLLIGMWLKYGPVGNELGVKIFGPLHGGAFLFYVVATVLSALRLRWPWWATLLALIAAVPPLVTVPLEMWFRRIGLLSGRA